jgi:hypothetical protein
MPAPPTYHFRIESTPGVYEDIFAESMPKALEAWRLAIEQRHGAEPRGTECLSPEPPYPAEEA